jgi:putative flippase GtrA
MPEWIPGKAPSAALAQRLVGRDSGIVGQGMRFGLAGGLTALIYLLTTSLLALVFGVPFQIALTIGFLTAAAFNFAMQRIFVWAGGEGFALPLHRQAGLYLSLAGAQYGVTLASTSLLPGPLGLPTEVVYLATAALLAGINFMVFRHRIFHSSHITATARSSL